MKEGADNFGKNFIAMPSRPDKTTESGYRDIVHPTNKDFREKLNNTVLKQHNEQLSFKNLKDKKQQPQKENGVKPASKAKKTNRDAR